MRPLPVVPEVQAAVAWWFKMLSGHKYQAAQGFMFRVTLSQVIFQMCAEGGWDKACKAGLCYVDQQYRTISCSKQGLSGHLYAAYSLAGISAPTAEYTFGPCEAMTEWDSIEMVVSPGIVVAHMCSGDKKFIEQVYRTPTS